MTEAEGWPRGAFLAEDTEFWPGGLSFFMFTKFSGKNACSWPYLTNNNGHQPAAGDLKNHLGTGMPGSANFLLCASDSR